MRDFYHLNTEPHRLIFNVLFVFVLLNLFIPGEGNFLTLILSQAVIFGFTGIYLLYIRPKTEISIWIVPAAFFAASLIISNFSTLHSYDSLRTSVYLVSVCLLTWLVSETASANTGKYTPYIVLVCVAVILSIIGLLQVVTFFSQPPESEVVEQFLPVSSHYLQQVYSQKRIFATFVLPTSFSAFLSMVLPFSIGLLIHHRKNKWALAGLSAAVLIMIAALIQTQSNGGPVALVGAALLTTLLFFRNKKIPVWRIIILFAVGGVMLLLAIGFLRGNFFWDLGAINSPIRLRWKLWMAGLAMLGKYGILGIGMNNFHLGFFQHLAADVRPTKFLHNSYLQLPLELGLLGAIALVLALILLVRSFVKRSKPKDDENAPLHYALLASVLIFMTVNFFEIILYFQSLGYLGAFLIGLWFRKSDFSADSYNLKKVKTKGRFNVWRLAAALSCLMALLMLGRWYLAEHFYNKASGKLTVSMIAQAESDLTSDDAELIESESQGMSDELWSEIDTLVNASIAIDSGNYRYYLLKAQLLQMQPENIVANSATEIVQAYKEAVILCPELPNLHYSLALAYLRQGNILAAAEELSEASRLHPTDENYHQAREAIESRLESLMQSSRIEENQ